MARPLLWLCHNFPTNTVFQAFFITLLVEPGLGKQIFTLEELNNFDISYSYHHPTKVYLNLSHYRAFVTLL